MLAQKADNKTLEVINLSKKYGNNKVAVNGLNLSMYSNQIFALLGHNGAGKTTTISMISGLLPITSGAIKVLGLDTVEDREKIKGVMGICPQTNPIYPMLSVEEHLYLYARVKKSQKTPAELGKEVETILKDIDLWDKRGYKSGKLSGGQKRKLCVACAFIAGSQVILLDEPTSGLDVAARRHLWEMLKKYKKDKIIILTTHFMDEADYLGDRIGVMGDGKLLTCGSSLFLKNKFGVGYSLTLVKSESNVSTEKITEQIQSKVPTSYLEGDISKELKYVLPLDELPNFEGLFQLLEEKSAELGIASFGVSLTTLEDVFLRIAEKLGLHKKEEESKPAEVLNNKKIEEAELDEVELEDIRIKGAWSIFTTHFMAMITKRLIYFKRDVKGLLCEIVIPILVILCGVLLTQFQLIQAPETGYLLPDKANLPSGKNPQMWVSNNFPNLASKVAAKNLIVEKKAISTIADFDSQLKANYMQDRIYASFVDSVDMANQAYGYSVFINTTNAHSLNTVLGIMNNAIIKVAMNDDNADIQRFLHPFPLTDQQQGFENLVDGFLLCFLVSLAVAFIPSSMIMFIVKERENNAKHQQIVSGVSLSAYWFSNLLIDYLKYLLVAIAAIVCIAAFDVSTFTQGDRMSMTIVLLIVAGFSIISFTYLASFLFKDPSQAQVVLFLFCITTGFVMMMGSFVLRLLKGTRDFHVGFTEYILRLFPLYDLCFGLFAMTQTIIVKRIFDLNEEPSAWTRYVSLFELIYLIALFFIQFGAIFLIEYSSSLVAKDEKKDYDEVFGSEEDRDDDVRQEAKQVKSSDDYTIKVQDLKKVFTMVKSGGCCSGKGVVETKVAVKGITFGVKKGECFGLLGTNGAGKTTTFKVLSGEISPTEGSATINGMNVAKEMKKVRHLIGYCPQFDALLEKMTAREHLEMYAAIKGIPKRLRKKLIDQKIEQLNLKKYEKVQAGTYSGGNKRKLSVAIALLGNPPVVFLDEPSSGMDPEARRFMWSVVGNVSSKTKKSSVVLTTHSMEEAEALSTKLAIMVEGHIKCIGPVQALKNKFGKGFEIETKLHMPEKEDLVNICNKAGFQMGHLESMIDESAVRMAVNKLEMLQAESEIFENGSGSYIANEVKNRIF